MGSVRTSEAMKRSETIKDETKDRAISKEAEARHSRETKHKRREI
jgi:hypothetical protein